MENLTLYEIGKAFNELMNINEEEMTEEIKLDIENKLTEMLKQKSNNIIGYAKNIELMINAMKEEENRIAKNRNSLEKKYELFMKYLENCLSNFENPKIQTSLGTISLKKNPLSVDILAPEKVPNKYKKQVLTVQIDKTAIKNDFKETGEIVDGVRYNTDKRSVSIK